MKRGVFFTLGVLIALIAFSTFAVLVYTNSLQSKERVAETGVLDRIFDLDSSIQNGLKEIFELKSGIIITIGPNSTAPGGGGPAVSIGPSPKLEGDDNRSIEFWEFVQNSNGEPSGTFLQENREFAYFVGNRSISNPSIDVNITKLQKVPLIVKPYNLLYTHEKGFGSREINIYPNNVKDIYQYEITFSTNFIGAQSLNITNRSVSTCDPPIIGINGCIALKINSIISDPDKINETYAMINATNYSEFIVFFGMAPLSQSIGSLVVTIDNPGQVNITNNLTNPSLIGISKVAIQFNYIYGDQEREKEAIHVYYPDETILINLDDLNIKKEGPVRIV